MDKQNDSARKYQVRPPPWYSYDTTPEWLVQQQLARQDISLSERLLQQQAEGWLLLLPQRLCRQRGALGALHGYDTLWEFFCESPIALRAMVLEGRAYNFHQIKETT